MAIIDPMPIYWKGETARLSTAPLGFTDNDIPLDPAVVTVSVRTPAGAKTTLVYGTDAAVKRDSVGIYYLDQVLTLSGTWTFRWTGHTDTPAYDTASEGSLFVEPSPF